MHNIKLPATIIDWLNTTGMEDIQKDCKTNEVNVEELRYGTLMVALTQSQVEEVLKRLDVPGKQEGIDENCTVVMDQDIPKSFLKS